MTGPHSQRGTTLIEVLVAFLVLSLGLLSLSGVMAYSIQLPKLAAYRATAMNLAASHIERIRANPAGFQGGGYAQLLSYDGTSADIPPRPCSYPHCTAHALAAMDSAAMAQAVRTALPAGGMLTTCTPSPCSALSQGDVWIVWQEPSTFAALNAATSDECPREVGTVFKDPVPRCIHMRFAL